MPRVTVVKKAQQRYYTKPVIDPATGLPKEVPVMKNGEQKKTKRGKLVTMKVTERDLDRPKPLLRCDFPGCDINGGEIAIGTGYKWIKPKSGPYGGQQRNRHIEHRSWYQWEYSSSLSARLAQISHDFWNAIDSCQDADDVQAALDDAGSEIESLAEEKRESASNIEDGFGHETSASQELNEIADQLDDWASEVTSADIPEQPDMEMVTKWYVNGPDAQSLNEEGYESEDEAEAAKDQWLNENPDEDPDEWVVEDEESDEEAEELTDEQREAWLDEVRDALSIIDESPV